jgi:hypothetical protein
MTSMLHPVKHEINSGLYNAIAMLQSELAMTSCILAFLAVCRRPGESIDYYARLCGCSPGAMSKRLGEMGELCGHDRSKPGLGLIENPPNPLDRRLRMVRLSPKGNALAERVVRLFGTERETVR